MVAMASRHLGVFKVAGNPQDLAEVGRTDEQQVHIGNRRNFCATLASASAVSIWMPTNVAALASAMYSARSVSPNRPSRFPPLRPRSPRGQNLAQRTACSASAAERTMLIITPPAPASSGRITEA